MKNKLKLLSFDKIRKYINNLWFKYFKNSSYYHLIVEFRNKREKNKERKRAINEFEGKFNISVDTVNKIMSHEKVYHENNPKTDYLNKKLVEGRGQIIELSRFIHRTPFFYEPEICEIHNEMLDTKKDDIDKIKSYDYKVTENLLKKQKLKVNLSPNQNKHKKEDIDIVLAKRILNMPNRDL